MVCDLDCFNCKFSDCILDFESGFFVELEEISSREIDDILFKNDSDSIVVPDWRQYPFIPSDEIPYNPKWKSQAKWREYYRSRARGNRKEKNRAKAKEYRQKHLEECKERSKNYYQNNRDRILAYIRKYNENHREENKIRCRKNYEKNRELRLEYQKEYYRKHKNISDK